MGFAQTGQIAYTTASALAPEQKKNFSVTGMYYFCKKTVVEKKIYDKELGSITLRTNPGVKRYSLKICEGTLVATMPKGGNEKFLLDFINEKRNELIRKLKENPPQNRLLNEMTEMQTCTFKLHIFCTDRENVYMSLKENVLHIACPRHTDFEKDHVQQLLKTLLEKALRHEARRVLPARLQTLAGRYGFSYAGVRIANTRSRWGSCNSKGKISLSLSLMLLPAHLVDYVLLHELCHTVEMNHKEGFWKLLNKVTSNNAQALRKELKEHQTL
jgi:predicted metal-dependent hydrolase